MRALITRPIDDAEQVAAALQGRGIEPVFEPLLAISPVPGVTLDLAGVQALLVTSRNGVRALAGATLRRDVPVYTVGDATAQTARDHGFQTVESAQGDGESLANLVIAKLDPKAGPLVHAAGQAVAGDLSGRLSDRGFTVRREVLYQASPATVLSDSTRDLLASGALDLALFFSPRTAQTFASLVTDAGLAGACSKISAVCLSNAIASRLISIPWRTVVTAERPDLQALISAIDGLTPGESQEPIKAGEGTLLIDGDASSAESPQPQKAARAAAGRSPWQTSSGAKKRGRTSAWALAGLLGILVIGILAWPAWRGYAPQFVQDWLAPGTAVPVQRPDAALSERLSTLERRLAQPAPPARDGDGALERRIAQLEARLAEAAARPAVTGDVDLARRVAQLESRLASTEGPDPTDKLSAAESALRAENERLAGRMADLERRLASLQERAAQASARVEGRRSDAQILAIMQLRDAVARGAPFGQELAAVAAVVKDDPAYAEAMATLRAHAERGVVPRRDLARRFAPVASAAVRAGIAPEGSDWVSRTAARLASVVTIRRVGEDVAGDKPDAAIARAEARLQEDDLAGAIAALERLDGGAAAAMATWLADARATLASEQALALLSRRALAAAASSN